MSFIIEPEVFEKLPGLFIGAVVIRGVDNTKSYPVIDGLLDRAVEEAVAQFEGWKVKEHPGILPYRAAFTELGINPNKFMPSIEALVTRITKGKGMPHINPVVDLGNAVSLKYLLPMGAHTLCEGDEAVRFARDGDVFTPFGEEQPETPDAGELIYACGSRVGTRRWIWRQSKEGMITPESTDIFYPIDGFDLNSDRVVAAAEELAGLCADIFGVTPCAIGAAYKGNNAVFF